MSNKFAGSIDADLSYSAMVVDVLKEMHSIPRGQIPMRPLNQLDKDLRTFILMRSARHSAHGAMYALYLLIVMRLFMWLDDRALNNAVGWMALGGMIGAGQTAKYIDKKTINVMERILENSNTLRYFADIYYRQMGER